MMVLNWKQILSFKSCHLTEQDGYAVLQGDEWDIHISFPVFWCRLCMDIWSVLLSHVATCSWTAWINSRRICHFQSVLIYIASLSTCCKKESLDILWRLCDDSTQPSYGFVSISLSIIRTIIAYNVNTYAVAHSHLRCLNNRTENRRQSYRTARVANVNQASETSAYIYDGTCTFNS